MALLSGESSARVVPVEDDDTIVVQLQELGDPEGVVLEPLQGGPLRDSWVSGSIDPEEEAVTEPTMAASGPSFKPRDLNWQLERSGSVDAAQRPPRLSPPPGRPPLTINPDVGDVFSGGSSGHTSPAAPPPVGAEKYMPFVPHIPSPHGSACSGHERGPLSPISGPLRPLPQQPSSGPSGTPPPDRPGGGRASPLPADATGGRGGAGVPAPLSPTSRPHTPPPLSPAERLHPKRGAAGGGVPFTPPSASAAKYLVGQSGSKTPPLQGPFLLNGQMRDLHMRSDSKSIQNTPGQSPPRCVGLTSPVTPVSSKRPNSAPPSLPVVVNADFSVTMEKMEECIVRVGCVKFLVPTRLLKRDKASNLQRMLDGEWEDVADDHPDGSFSIKRNPTLFPAVLQVLQGAFTFPCGDVSFLTSLLAELEFYDLQKAKGELLQHYPFLRPGAAQGFAGGHGLRYDGMYFAIITPSLSALAHDEFSYATPDNVIRAFRFKVNGSVLRYKKQEKTTHVSLALDEEGLYEHLPPQRVACNFKDGSACHFSRDANGILVLEFKLKAHKVVFHSDDEMVAWMRLRFPT